jgi:hypothetical protein
MYEFLHKPVDPLYGLIFVIITFTVSILLIMGLLKLWIKHDEEKERIQQHEEDAKAQLQLEQWLQGQKERSLRSRSLPLRAEIPDQVRYDGDKRCAMQKKAVMEGGGVLRCAFGRWKNASGGGSSLRKDDEDKHSAELYQQWWMGQGQAFHYAKEGRGNIYYGKVS